MPTNYIGNAIAKIKIKRETMAMQESYGERKSSNKNSPVDIKLKEVILKIVIFHLMKRSLLGNLFSNHCMLILLLHSLHFY